MQAADEQQKIQIEILQQMRDLGFMGGTIPVEWGGLGLDQVTFTVLLEEMAWADQVIAGVMSMPSSLIGSGILKYGSTEQKERWLRPLAEGRHFGGAGITEPRSGSDVSGLITSPTYERCSGVNARDALGPSRAMR